MLEEELLREAILPWEAYLLLTRQATSGDLAESLLTDFLANTVVQTALHVSAPGVYDYLAAHNFSPAGLSRAWQITLWKYLTRMHSRATPYGLFAAVSLPIRARADKSVTAGHESDQPAYIALCLDHELLTVLYRCLLRQPDFRWQQRYWLNNTLTGFFSRPDTDPANELASSLDDVHRPNVARKFYTYTGFVQPGGELLPRTAHPVPLLKSIEANAVLDDLLTSFLPDRAGLSQPRTTDELLTCLLAHTSDRASASTYIDYLIDNTVLTGEFTPWVTEPAGNSGYEWALAAFLNREDLSITSPVTAQVRDGMSRWLGAARACRDTPVGAGQGWPQLRAAWAEAVREAAILWSWVSTESLPDSGVSQPVIPGDCGMQADSYRVAAEPTSNTNKTNEPDKQAPTQELSDALSVLAALTPAPAQTDLHLFRERFTRRYDDAFVPLLEALNPDEGVGYQTGEAGYSPLLADFPDPPAVLSAGIAYGWATEPAADMLAAWHRAGCPREGITRTPAEIRSRYITSSTSSISPKSRSIRDAGGYLLGEWVSLEPYDSQPIKKKVQAVPPLDHQKQKRPVFRLGMAAGTSPATILGRFTGSLPALLDRCRTLLAPFRPDTLLGRSVIEAEINYLPVATPRQGNVLRRPWLRTAEISYMQPPSLPPTDNHLSNAGCQLRADKTEPTEPQNTPIESQNTLIQIPLSELYVGCPGGQVVLYWPREKKWVIPRLASAHNKLWGDEVYRFLLDVQTTWGYWSAHWSWGAYGTLHRLPRIQIGALLVAPARWRLTDTDKRTPLEQLKKELDLPQRVVLADGDNRLLMDLASFPGQLLFEEARSKIAVAGQSLYIEEWLAPVGTYVQETVYSLTTTGDFMQQVLSRLPAVPLAASRLFPLSSRLLVPGQDWWYVKLYGSVVQADFVLRMMEDALGGQTDWFFIRYADPDPHIRLRWRVKPSETRSTPTEVTPTPNTITPDIMQTDWSALIASGQLSRVELVTYQPEWERYGRVAYPQIESLFCRDSRFVRSQINGLTESDEEEKLLAALCSAYHFIQASGLLKADKRAFWERGQRQYLLEQPDEKAARTWLNTFYRRLSGAIDVWLSKPLSDTEKSYYAQTEVALTALRDHYQRGEDAPLVYETVVTSLLHMHLNRWFTVQPRRCELLVYHCLTRWSLIPDQHKRNLKAIE